MLQVRLSLWGCPITFFKDKNRKQEEEEEGEEVVEEVNLLLTTLVYFISIFHLFHVNVSRALTGFLSKI